MPKRKESAEQSAFFDYFSHYPSFKYVLFAIPNGGSRHIVEATNLKRQGVKSGVWDVFLAIPRGTFHGLWLEFKVNKNKLTTHQQLFGQEMKNRGYCTKVCYSCEEGIKEVWKYVGRKDVL